MRMWNVSPKLLCRKHLLGEHRETHALIGCISRGKSIRGYIDKGLVEVHNIINRHNELVEEMVNRGYNHQSEIHTCELWREGSVDVNANILELRKRCPECKERIDKMFEKHADKIKQKIMVYADMYAR